MISLSHTIAAQKDLRGHSGTIAAGVLDVRGSVPQNAKDTPALRVGGRPAPPLPGKETE
jgi:hypothetical protein